MFFLLLFIKITKNTSEVVFYDFQYFVSRYDFIKVLPGIIRKVNLVAEGHDPEEAEFTQEVHGTEKEAKEAGKKLYKKAKRMVWLKNNGKSIFIESFKQIGFAEKYNT